MGPTAAPTMRALGKRSPSPSATVIRASLSGMLRRLVPSGATFGYSSYLERLAHTSSVPISVLMAAVLRVPCLNRLGHLLRTKLFQRLLAEPTRWGRAKNKALFSADTIVDVLDTVDMLATPAAPVLVTEIRRGGSTKHQFRDGQHAPPGSIDDLDHAIVVNSLPAWLIIPL